MGLLQLPTELRLQILEYLPELSYGRSETVGPNVRLTPAISRTSRQLRKDSLPLYAKTSNFIISTDDNLHNAHNRVHAWLRALGAAALAKVESLQLSRHWKIKQPSRWQGHVGFYVRLILVNRRWQCTAGTYPFANDNRGMRRESVDLLLRVVNQRLQQRFGTLSESNLEREDVEFIVDAMDVVASHPISSFDTEQSQAGWQRRRETWSEMERGLAALQAVASDKLDSSTRSTRFYTPY